MCLDVVANTEGWKSRSGFVSNLEDRTYDELDRPASKVVPVRFAPPMSSRRASQGAGRAR